MRLDQEASSLAQELLDSIGAEDVLTVTAYRTLHERITAWILKQQHVEERIPDDQAIFMAAFAHQLRALHGHPYEVSEEDLRKWQEGDRIHCASDYANGVASTHRFTLVEAPR
jgi:hypothetical protein